MTERTREERLNEYIDGALPSSEAREFEAQLERDPDLRAEMAALRTLLAEARALRDGVAPRRDLWGSIEPCLGESQRATALKRFAGSRLGQGLLAAAAALLIFGAGMWFARLDAQRSPSTPQVAVAPREQTNRTPVKVELAGYKQIELEYADVRTSLHEALDKARPDLAPETVKVIDDSLATIDNAIREIELALANDPGNRALMQSLVAVYDQEVGLLRQVARIADGTQEDNA